MKTPVFGEVYVLAGPISSRDDASLAGGADRIMVSTTARRSGYMP
ncbi:MAG: hypothetical protein RBT81_01920 [Gammaproteobacteria bacterium]|jgi:hypothetical protein|nr:hypothetical protein [Gammaproteobacteria bacterium]